MPSASPFYCHREGLDERFALIFVFFFLGFLGDFFHCDRLLASGFFADFFNDYCRLGHMHWSRFSWLFLLGLLGFNAVLYVGSSVGRDAQWFCGSNRFHYSGGGFFSFLGQALGFALTATHFTWVVRCTAIASDYWRGFNHFCDYNHFSHFYRGFRSRFDSGWRSFHNWSFNGGSFSWSRFNNQRCFHGGSRFCSNRRFGNWCWSKGGFGSRRFYRRSFHSGSRFNRRSLDHIGFNHIGFNSRWLTALSAWCFSSFASCSLAISNNFADHSGSGRRYSRGDSGIAGVFAAGFFGACFFAAFDDVAVGITLTLTAVAATTLTTGTTAWTIATLGVFLLFVVLLFGAQYFFFVTAGIDHWTRLTLFTRGTWLTLFARLTLGTLFARGFLALGI